MRRIVFPLLIILSQKLEAFRAENRSTPVTSNELNKNFIAGNGTSTCAMIVKPQTNEEMLFQRTRLDQTIQRIQTREFEISRRNAITRINNEK